MSEDIARQVRHSAVAALARREHSRAELIKKLCGKGYALNIVEAEIDRLVADKMQDDRRFAESYIRHRASRGYGPVKIKHELSQRGVDDNTANTAFAEADIDWDESAFRVWEKKFKRAPESYADQAKQVRFLTYRGFTGDQTARVTQGKF